MTTVHKQPVRSEVPDVGPFPSPPPIRQSWQVLAVLMMAGCLSSAAGAVVAPVFPEIVEYFGLSSRWAGVLVSTHTLTTALASLVFGLLARRLGSVRILLSSLVAYAVFGGLGAIANGFWGLLCSRALVGVASGGIGAGSIGILSNLYDGEARTRMMGYATSALATATVIFPILGGWLGLYHWRLAFWLYGLGLPVAVVGLWLLPKGRQRGANIPQADGIGSILKRSRVLVLLLALATASAIFYVVVVYAPLYLKQAIDASSLLNGFVLAARSVGAAVIAAVGAAKVSKKLGSGGAIATGFLLMALSLATIPSVLAPSLMLIAGLLFGLGFGLVMPNFYSALADLSPDSQRSGVLAIGTGCASLGQFISPFIFGPIWAGAGTQVFYLAAAIAATVGVLNWIRR
ncbi:MFS transporter [Leptothoe kymatousa]|uniref:MFS transporter n=1 Tax=Leptothoe kymatousa TAU-MAC 1615 TaxID=2364775 RepID=A0ABS5Y050_9CYAN|nr:MFS transporter [Leptothoe kymatousa]MBT9311196.1 MFS transporter [Leptothoe kymatousa TAU-MAC 1615]